MPVEVQASKISIAHAFLACWLKGVEGRNGEMSIRGRDDADMFTRKESSVESRTCLAEHQRLKRIVTGFRSETTCLLRIKVALGCVDFKGF